MGHSKGGIDSAAALAMHASLRPLVAGIVFVQTPYGGSPVATDLMEGDGIEFELLRAFVLDFLASILRTKADAGVDLTYSERRAFLERFPLDPQDPSYLRRPTAAELPEAGTRGHRRFPARPLLRSPAAQHCPRRAGGARSEEHTSALLSPAKSSNAV